MDFVARALVQIPDPRRQLVRYHGFYSNVARGKRKKAAPAEPSASGEALKTETTPERADRLLSISGSFLASAEALRGAAPPR